MERYSVDPLDNFNFTSTYARMIILIMGYIYKSFYILCRTQSWKHINFFVWCYFSKIFHSSFLKCKKSVDVML